MDILRTKLEEGSDIALDWFEENHMKANISKFQSIIMLRPTERLYFRCIILYIWTYTETYSLCKATGS